MTEIIPRSSEGNIFTAVRAKVVPSSYPTYPHSHRFQFKHLFDGLKNKKVGV
ncbi:hypothetical protein QWZ16_13585 [Vibrio ostreicida]|uniref:Uncharacterized protein n=1 Tax=Vibrio ostreicida TaxID=526588 RepID=A0ABT8BVQ5_9VIBR|nr:hypothetical protein [Vibrio ostreicida]MDN3610738.1 hypothetical protein [Vibrio ostreicida]